MQRYGDYWLIPNNWLFSYPVCCDRQPDLRQNAKKDPKTVANCLEVRKVFTNFADEFAKFLKMGKDDFRKDLIRGSLIGGAIGDALGYAVEFDSYQRIISKYGPQGIREYDLKNGVAEISDDTQMTLFTANGILMGVTRGFMRGVGSLPHFYVEYAYQDWYYTQTETFENRISNKGKDNILISSW